MNDLGGLTFDDPKVELAVTTAAFAYGDHLSDVVAGRTSARRCLSVAGSALALVGLYTIADAGRALGIDPKVIRVARYRKSPAFLRVEARVAAVLRGEKVQARFGDCSGSALAAEALKRAWADPARRAALSAAAVRNVSKAREAKKRQAGEGRQPPRCRMPEHVARKLPYLKRFVAAGWTVGETAKLFDLGWRTVERAVARG